MVLGPLLIVVILLLGLLLVIWALVLSSPASGPESQHAERTAEGEGRFCHAPGCGRRNEPAARFCAGCGSELIPPMARDGRPPTSA